MISEIQDVLNFACDQRHNWECEKKGVFIELTGLLDCCWLCHENDDLTYQLLEVINKEKKSGS